MHYVLKNKISHLLLAAARRVRNEFFRVQARILTIDQNNLGDGGTSTGALAPYNTGLYRGSFFPASSSSSASQARNSYGSLTRVHTDESATSVWDPTPPTGFPTGEYGSDYGWVDQTTSAFLPAESSDITFTTYHTGPYLFIAQATVWGEVQDPASGEIQNPLRAGISVRVDGSILEPTSVGSYALNTTAVTNFIYAPLFFQGSKVLTPGAHRATVTLNNYAGVNIDVKYNNLVVVGLLR